MDRKMVALLAFAMTGCSGGNSPSTDASATGNDQPTASLSSPELTKITEEMSAIAKLRASPDQTVESFIKIKNLRERAECHFESAKISPENAVDWARIKNDEKTYYAFMSGIMRAQLSKWSEPRDLKTCLERAAIYAVDVREVSKSSEDRALVIANVRNVTPIPDGADRKDMERRNAGQTVRYVLGRGTDGWTIANYEDNGEDGWKPYFEESRPALPYLPWIVVPF